MLELSTERSLGAHTYFVPVEHTEAARNLFGPTSILAPELACVLDDDVESARAKARAYAATYLGLRNHTPTCSTTASASRTSPTAARIG